MTIELFLVGLVSLIAGLALGYFVAARKAAEFRDKFLAAIRDLESARKDAEALPELRADREALIRLQSQQEERERQHAERTQQLKEQFETLAASVLDKSHKAFIDAPTKPSRSTARRRPRGLKKTRRRSPSSCSRSRKR